MGDDAGRGAFDFPPLESGVGGRRAEAHGFESAKTRRAETTDRAVHERNDAEPLTVERGCVVRFSPVHEHTVCPRARWRVVLARRDTQTPPLKDPSDDDEGESLIVFVRVDSCNCVAVQLQTRSLELRGTCRRYECICRLD